MSEQEALELQKVAEASKRKRVHAYKEDWVERAVKAEMRLHQVEHAAQELVGKYANACSEIDRLNAIIAAKNMTVLTLVGRWFR